MYPLFIHDKDTKEEITSMTGCFRLSFPHMLAEIEESIKLGIVSFILFPKIPDEVKSNYAEEAYNPNGIVPRALVAIKSKFPNVIIATDIALDPYSSQVSELQIYFKFSNSYLYIYFILKLCLYYDFFCNMYSLLLNSKLNSLALLNERDMMVLLKMAKY